MNSADSSTDKKRRSGKTRSGRRFNVLDALIVLIIVAVITLTLLAYLPSGLFGLSEKNSDATIIYTVEIQGIERELAKGIAVGDPVTEKETSVNLGSVSAEVEVSPYSRVRYDAASGEVVLDEFSELSTLLITVTAPAESDPSRGYSVGGRRIAIGAELTLSLPGFEGSGKCISITEISGKGG